MYNIAHGPQNYIKILILATGSRSQIFSNCVRALTLLPLPGMISNSTVLLYRTCRYVMILVSAMSPKGTNHWAVEIVSIVLRCQTCMERFHTFVRLTKCEDLSWCLLNIVNYRKNVCWLLEIQRYISVFQIRILKSCFILLTHRAFCVLNGRFLTRISVKLVQAIHRGGDLEIQNRVDSCCHVW